MKVLKSGLLLGLILGVIIVFFIALQNRNLPSYFAWLAFLIPFIIIVILVLRKFGSLLKDGVDDEKQ
ncbi:hypothetical protein [Paenibacillus chitinolyticus]|uniref:hypothetical protein n=1 Tax=Paenibacillus chitinolyticus TaxID=79263 RepID=UPI001C451B19|nr:hypothetical protein [Paenibacillus chitinolyticus]MBV6717226.1 hypothetical protein [Paenibacillus chitinolyticus]